MASGVEACLRRLSEGLAMPTTPPRHLRLVRFFQGRLANEDLYSQAVLSGPGQRARVEMMSYMALYADRDLPYATLVPSGALSSRQAAIQVRGLRFPEETAQAESRGARATVVGSPADVDETIWQLGVRQTEHFDLPVIFVSWMRIIETRQPKIMLWYASMTQGRWALARFKNELLQQGR
jgi:hypothetical protein